MDPSQDEILKAINDSGYLLEQQIASKIEKNGFHIVTNAAFKDLDEEKSREMDVVAYKSVYHDSEKKISVAIRILCECKNSRSPFLFITRNKGRIDDAYIPPNFLFSTPSFNEPVEGNPKAYRETPAFKHLGIDNIFPYSKAVSKAVQFCKLIQKNKEWTAVHDGFYDATLLPLSKCLEFYKKEDGWRNSDWKFFVIYFPIIVTTSRLYYIESHIDPTVVKEAETIPFTRSVKNTRQNETYLFDFVQSESLEKYIIDHVEGFADQFVKKVSQT